MPTAWCAAALFSFVNIVLMLFLFLGMSTGPAELAQIRGYRVGPLTLIALARIIGGLFLAYVALEMLVTWRRAGPGQWPAWVRCGASLVFLAGYQVVLLMI